jgi:hypothetical protein
MIVSLFSSDVCKAPSSSLCSVLLSRLLCCWREGKKEEKELRLDLVHYHSHILLSRIHRRSIYVRRGEKGGKGRRNLGEKLPELSVLLEGLELWVAYGVETRQYTLRRGKWKRNRRWM